jgi:hypothetical protein
MQPFTSEGLQMSDLSNALRTALAFIKPVRSPQPDFKILLGLRTSAKTAEALAAKVFGLRMRN